MLEDWLDLGADLQRHIQAHCWFGFGRFCVLEDWLGLGADLQRHIQAHCWFGFGRFCVLEDWLDLGADLQRQIRAHWFGFWRLYALEIPHPLNCTLSAAGMELVYFRNKPDQVLNDDKESDGCTSECNKPIRISSISHVRHPDAS